MATTMVPMLGAPVGPRVRSSSALSPNRRCARHSGPTVIVGPRGSPLPHGRAPSVPRGLSPPPRQHTVHPHQAVIPQPSFIAQDVGSARVGGGSLNVPPAVQLPGSGPLPVPTAPHMPGGSLTLPPASHNAVSPPVPAPAVATMPCVAASRPPSLTDDNLQQFSGCSTVVVPGGAALAPPTAVVTGCGPRGTQQGQPPQPPGPCGPTLEWARSNRAAAGGTSVSSMPSTPGTVLRDAKSAASGAELGQVLSSVMPPVVVQVKSDQESIGRHIEEQGHGLKHVTQVAEKTSQEVQDLAAKISGMHSDITSLKEKTSEPDEKVNETAAGKEMRLWSEMMRAELEESKRQAREAQAAEKKATEQARHLQAECERKDGQFQELEEKHKKMLAGNAKRKKEVEEQISTLQADKTKLQSQIERLETNYTRLQDENTRLRDQRGREVKDAEKKRSQIEELKRSLQSDRAQQDHELQSRRWELEERQQKLDRQEAQMQSSLHRSREQKIQSQEHARLAEEQLEARLRDAREFEDRMRLDKECVAQQRTKLEKREMELDVMQQQLERCQQELTRQENEQRERHRVRAQDNDKENKGLKQKVEEQRSALYSLQHQLHLEQAVVNFMTPGEFIRKVKRHESDAASKEISEHRLRSFGLEREIQEVRWHNEVMQKHLSGAAQEEVKKQLCETPLPPREAA